MHYGDLEHHPHIAKGLQVLRQRIDRAEIPSSKLDESFNVATWNIRNFGDNRDLAAKYFIAEVLNQFDLIAITELRSDLRGLRDVMAILGREWDVIFSDYESRGGGNSERIGYLFDTRMVQFTGLAAEANPRREKDDTGEWVNELSWWRSPYMASFRAGSFDFVAITMHARWGESTEGRKASLAHFREWITTRRGQQYGVDKDFIVMGDFNVSKTDGTFDALVGDGKTLKIPPDLVDIDGTTLNRQNMYDQILHSPSRAKRFEGQAGEKVGGLIDFLRDDAGNVDWEALYPDEAHRPAGEDKFTYQMSDHFPLWLQVRTDIVDDRLQIMAAGE